MKLTQLIPYLLDENNLERIYDDFNLNKDSEEVIIFMRDQLDIDSEITFFDYEETDGEMEVEKDGVGYIYLFSIDYASELLLEDLNLKGKGYTDLEIAQRLLEYRIKDA